MRLLAAIAATVAFRGCMALSNKTLSVSIPDAPSSAANVVYDNFLGISWELFPLSYLWGESADALPAAMQNYLSNIRARQGNPLRIRIGGNSMDGSTYVANQTEMITLTDSDAYYNDVPCNFGPTLFEVLNAMSAKVGSMQFILGLSMRDPSEPDNVLELTAAAESYLGSSLDALLLGNEPDLYANHGTRGNYTIDDYIPEIETMLAEMGSSSFGNLTENRVIGGPTVCCSWDLDEVLNAGLKDLPYKYYTIQHYPNNVCSGSTASSSNISYYISHANTVPFLSWNDAGIEIAKEVGVPMLLTEYNSASCGGDPSVAPTFAATLWAVDAALQGAALNFSGAYLHTRELGVTYNLFEPSASDTSMDGNWTTGSTYYAELVLAEALSPNGSIVVDLDLDDSKTSYDSSVAAYAIYDGDDKDKSKLVLFNFDYAKSDSDSDDTTSNQTFVLPSNLTTQIGVRYLLASNISTTTNTSGGITWAGQKAGGSGALHGTQEIEFIDCSSGCNVSVPGPGLVVIWLDTNTDLQLASIYQGNSTIAHVDHGDGDVSGEKTAAGARRSPSLHTNILTLATIWGGMAFAMALS